MARKPPANKKTTSQYKKEVKERWGRLISVVDEYQGYGVYIKHRCSKGHTFMNRPSMILYHNFVYDTPCSVCHKIIGSPKRKTHDAYVQQVEKVHKGKITVIGQYKQSHHNIQHKCNSCGFIWSATPDNVVNTSKTGCPKCNNSRGFSNKAIRWIKYMARKDRVRIRHGDNYGEYYIPELTSRRIKVDGFCKKTNTIYEFYGSCFHGDPSVFKPRQKCHPFNKKVTAQALYKATIEREELLKSLGYNVKSIWESDYDDKVRKGKIY